MKKSNGDNVDLYLTNQMQKEKLKSVVPVSHDDFSKFPSSHLWSASLMRAVTFGI